MFFLTFTHFLVTLFLYQQCRYGAAWQIVSFFISWGKLERNDWIHLFPNHAMFLLWVEHLMYILRVFLWHENPAAEIQNCLGILLVDSKSISNGNKGSFSCDCSVLVYAPLVMNKQEKLDTPRHGKIMMQRSRSLSNLRIRNMGKMEDQRWQWKINYQWEFFLPPAQTNI